MNEHTKKLLDQALDQAVPETWTRLSHEQMIKLSTVFAELIVRECADVAFLEANSRKTQRAVLQHFGVEE